MQAIAHLVQSVTPTTADFDDYARSNWTWLVKSAHLLGLGPQDAEDAAQSALLNLYRSWDRVRAAENVDGYVYRALVNAARRLLRPAWRRELVIDVPEDRAVTSDAAAGLQLREALLCLPMSQRSVVVLRYMNDYSVDEVARLLKIPPGTVKSRSARGLVRMGVLLTTDEGEI